VFQFSNHTGYAHVRGQRLSDTELTSLYEGLRLNGLDHYSHILSGYCGNESFLRKVGDIVKEQREKNPKVRKRGMTWIAL
jgi:pyridoxine kinase